MRVLMPKGDKAREKAAAQAEFSQVVLHGWFKRAPHSDRRIRSEMGISLCLNSLLETNRMRSVHSRGCWKMES